MTRQVITPRFVLRPQRRTTTRCDTAPTMTLRRDASPASPGRRPAIAGSSTPPSALLSRRMTIGAVLYLRWFPPPTTAFMLRSTLIAAREGRTGYRLHYRWLEWERISPH